jgi:hypothetical protein
MERRVGDVEKPLTIEEIRGKLSLRNEKMNRSHQATKKVKVLKKMHF